MIESVTSTARYKVNISDCTIKKSAKFIELSASWEHPLKIFIYFIRKMLHKSVTIQIFMEAER